MLACAFPNLVGVRYDLCMNWLNFYVLSKSEAIYSGLYFVYSTNLLFQQKSMFGLQPRFIYFNWLKNMSGFTRAGALP